MTLTVIWRGVALWDDTERPFFHGDIHLGREQTVQRRFCVFPRHRERVGGSFRQRRKNAAAKPSGLHRRRLERHLMIPPWCNGSTGVFGALSSGSNPEGGANFGRVMAPPSKRNVHNGNENEGSTPSTPTIYARRKTRN